jgi:hypothetical protein
MTFGRANGGQQTQSRRRHRPARRSVCPCHIPRS